jgi:gas vesicle protein
MSSGKVVLGLLAGFAAGALAGILFAPAKGSRTRRRIMKKGEDYADVLKEKFNDLLETVTEKMEKVKEEVSHFADKKVVKPEKAEQTV